MVTVPEPEANDPEAVVTALETAAIFGAQGDAREAVRWVRRAAEIASDEGSDLRALALARAVADMNTSTSLPPRPPPLPAAPVTSSVPTVPGTTAIPAAARRPDLPARTREDDPDGDAETRVVDADQMIAKLQIAPPGGRGNGTAVAYDEAAAARANSTTPEEDETTPISPSGVGSIAALLARKAAELPSALAASAEAAAMPAQATAPAIHQAVRASVEPSAKEGVFVLRLLAPGEPPGPSAQEAYVVVTDANAELFGRR